MFKLIGGDIVIYWYLRRCNVFRVFLMLVIVVNLFIW